MFLSNTKFIHCYSAVQSVPLFMNLIFEYDLVTNRHQKWIKRAKKLISKPADSIRSRGQGSGLTSWYQSMLDSRIVGLCSPHTHTQPAD